MSDDYLWDRSGPPDPEVERLENLLRPFAVDKKAARPPIPMRRLGSRRTRRVTWLAAAAAVFIGALGIWVALRVPRSGWQVTQLEGTPRAGSRTLSRADRLAAGEWLQTDGSSRARVTVDSIGYLDIDPNTRIQLVTAAQDEHRFSLAEGTIHAAIWARPLLFFVDTPSARAADLGCAYTLEVDRAGNGMLLVQAGWVGFDYAGRESFVPQGTRCESRAGTGPGTPYFDDGTPAFVAALRDLDFGGGGSAALDILLREARPQDALSLWHLLSRQSGEARARIYERLAALVPPPAAVTREGILRRDPDQLDLWWNELGLGSTTLWRLWKGTLAQPLK